MCPTQKNKWCKETAFHSPAPPVSEKKDKNRPHLSKGPFPLQDGGTKISCVLPCSGLALFTTHTALIQALFYIGECPSGHLRA